MRHENKFKVGDRVHYDDRLTKGIGTIRMRAPWSEGFDCGVEVAEHDRVRAYHKGNVRWFLARDLIPTITIEPGRHYRTRSGKVTGRVSKGDTGFEAVVDGRVRIFDKAGGAVHGDDDIVDAWVPKVGERVRFVRDNTDGGSMFGAMGEEVTVMSEASDVGNCLVNVSSSNFKWYPGAYLADLEPLPVAPQPAAPTLKIEAGRYYKTRDGRKVGPMTYAWGNIYAADGKQWRRDGYYWNGVGGHEQNNIIAEWIDEPVAKPGNDNAKPKLKVGDRISGYAPAFGAVTGIITAFDNSSPTQTYMIRDDKSGHTMWVDNYSIELITTPTTTAIVALIENGQPKPSSTPHVHTSEVAAHKEAGRLAAKHKGQQFGVFKLTATHREERVYEHKWQNMAYLGLKIGAIKELRAVAGLNLKAAKDAVEAWIEYENAA